MHVVRMQTLVIWSASGLTLGVTLSSILTWSRTSSGILFNSAGLMVLSYNKKKKTEESKKSGNRVTQSWTRAHNRTTAVDCCTTLFLRMAHMAWSSSSWSVSSHNHQDYYKHVFPLYCLDPIWTKHQPTLWEWAMTKNLSRLLRLVRMMSIRKK